MKVWITGLVGLAIGVIGMAAFGSIGTSGEYQLTVHNGLINYVFPLRQLTDDSLKLVCNPADKYVVFSLAKDGKEVRALKFCGSVEFKTDALKQVSYNLK